MQQRWRLSHGLSGYHVSLYETPWYVLPAETLGGWLIEGTRHRICCRQPEWAWKVPLGRARRDEEGFLENSLGGALHGLGTSLSAPFWRREKRVLELQVTDAEAFLIDPAWVTEMDEIMAEE